MTLLRAKDQTGEIERRLERKDFILFNDGDRPSVELEEKVLFPNFGT